MALIHAKYLVSLEEGCQQSRRPGSDPHRGVEADLYFCQCTADCHRCSGRRNVFLIVECHLTLYLDLTVTVCV